MKVLVLSNGSLTEKDIPNELENLQREVGGYIEAVPFIDGFADRKITVFVNEEGRYLPDATPQLVITHGIFIADILVGNVLFVGYDGVENTCGLTDEQMKFIKSKLRKKIPYHGKMVYVID